jgi:hypothetical protein
MQKGANAITKLILERVRQYGPRAAVVGAGLAGLNHLVAEINREKKRREDQESKDNSIYLEIPKTASLFETPSGSQYLLDSGVIAGTMLGSGLLGYKAVDEILKAVRKKRYNDELEKVKKEYSRLLSQKIYGLENQKQAGEIEYPHIEAMAMSIYKMSKEAGIDNETMEKAAISDPTMGTLFASLPGLGALVSGILAHNYWYNRQKDIQRGIEKQEAESIKRTPAVIKIKTVPRESDIEVEAKEAGVLGSSPLDSVATLESLVSLAERNKEKDKENPKDTDNKQREKGAPVFRDSDIQPVDHNTIVVNTDEGDTQVEALDPDAVKMLEKYKEVIAKSLAIGANLNNSPKEKE